MARTRARRRRPAPKWSARKVFRLGPYFRRFGATVVLTRGGRRRLGWTSQGFMFGDLTANLTAGTYAYNTPGPGGVRDLPIPEWIMVALESTRLTRWLTAQPPRR